MTRTYLVRESLLHIFYGVFILGCMVFLVHATSSELYKFITAVTAFGVLNQVAKFLAPGKFVLSPSGITMPGFFTGQKHQLRYDEIKGHLVFSVRFRRYLFVRTHQAVYKVPVDNFLDWDKFYSDFKTRVPELKREPLSPVVKSRLAVIGLIAALPVALAVIYDFLPREVGYGALAGIGFLVIIATFAGRKF